MPNLDAIRQLIEAAQACGKVPAHLIEAAAREYWDIFDAPEPDARKLETHERKKKILHLLDQGLTRAQICARNGWSTQQYHYALGCMETRNTSLELNRRNSNRSQRR